MKNEQQLSQTPVMPSVIFAKDLRVGNLVYLYNPEHWEEFINKIVSVECIETIMTTKEKEIWKNSFGSLKLVSGENQFNQFSEYVKPIEITEDLLLKIGAIKLDFKDFLSFNLFGTQINFINGLWIDYVSRVEIKGLHHLQNIFYFRNSEELNVSVLTEA